MACRALAGPDDRQTLEQLCRYITRPALPNERVQTNAAGQVVLRLKTPWRDGTKHLVMSPLEFMQRQVEWRRCGSQIPECYVGSGSVTVPRKADLRLKLAHRNPLERTARRLALSSSLRLIVVPGEKLLEVMGDDVSQEQAFAHANDLLKDAVGGDIRNSSDSIHIPGWVRSPLRGREDRDERAGLGRTEPGLQRAGAPGTGAAAVPGSIGPRQVTWPLQPRPVKLDRAAQTCAAAAAMPPRRHRSRCRC